MIHFAMEKSPDNFLFHEFSYFSPFFCQFVLFHFASQQHISTKIKNKYTILIKNNFTKHLRWIMANGLRISWNPIHSLIFVLYSREESNKKKEGKPYTKHNSIEWGYFGWKIMCKIFTLNDLFRSYFILNGIRNIFFCFSL